jgi:fumarylacetoacetase
MTRPIDDSHDPNLRSWVEAANREGADFPIQNLPVGVFRRRETEARPRIGVAIGDQILDLLRCREVGLLEGFPDVLRQAAAAAVLNPLMALSAESTSRLRQRLVKILAADGWGADPRAIVPMAEADLRLPADIGDYTDFYASIFHATNVGRLFRPDSPLLPNYKHVPIAYHGRGSSLVVSGTPIVRPRGQKSPREAELPMFGASQLLDYEVEIGTFVGRGNDLGHPVALDEAEDHIFGLCLVNDWSARDIQAWESQPLGPFLSKSFATSLSPWIVTLDALAPFRCPAFVRPPGDPQALPYLASTRNEREGGIDVTVEVYLRSALMRQQGREAVRLSRGSCRDMYWTMAQMLAHHTSNGCNLRPGDLLASGTISGPDEGSVGCLLEMTRRGTRPFELPTGEQRSFLADGDEVIFQAYCERHGYRRIGFGECSGLVLPAR